jgi:hypothetical protein
MQNISDCYSEPSIANFSRDAIFFYMARCVVPTTSCVLCPLHHVYCAHYIMCTVPTTSCVLYPLHHVYCTHYIMCTVPTTSCVHAQIERRVPQCRCPLQSCFNTYSLFIKCKLLSRQWILQLDVWNVTTYNLPKFYQRFGRTCLPLFEILLP